MQLSRAFSNALFAICAISAQGALSAANLAGTVQDKAGAAIPNATLEITSSAGAKVTAKTGSDGKYRFSNLPAGSYSLSAMAEGFAPATVAKVDLQGSKTSTTNVTLLAQPAATKSSMGKQLDGRELFFSAQAPAAKAVVKTASAPPAPRSTRTPAKPVEIARAETKPRTQSPAPPAPATPAPVQTATLVATTAPEAGLPPLGIRYSILRINSDNSTTEVPQDTEFHSGDRIRFTVEPNAPGYLYIVNQGSSGTWKPIFPSPEIDGGSNKVEGFHPYTMPPASRLAFDATVGTENLFIVFSRQPQDDLEKMIYSLQGAKPAAKPEESVRTDRTMIVAANINNSAVDRMRKAYGRDLIVEKVDSATPGDRKETAVYVVNPSGSADARVVADLHLVHR